MNKTDFNKLNDKIDLIEKTDDITNYQMYVLIAEYVDNILKSADLEFFLKQINLESSNIESNNLLYSYNKIKLVHEIITSPDEKDCHGRDYRDSVNYTLDFGYINSLKFNSKKVTELVISNLKRQDYKFHLLKFHKAFSSYLGFNKNSFTHDAQNHENITVYVSDVDGVFIKDGNKKLSYPVLRKSKRAKLIWKLGEGIISGPDLEEYLESKLPNIKQEINDINEIFRKELGLKEDLIVHVGTGGYTFNDLFIVKFL